MGLKEVEKIKLLRLRSRRCFVPALNHTDTPGIVEDQGTPMAPERERI